MSEIGIIGAIYEDRRTKKQGKLIERDEKYKTLLMEASDGKSFNITFGGFKSNWRKVDEPEQTVEEAMAEAVPEEQLVLKKQKKAKSKTKKRKKATPTEVSEGMELTVTTLANFVNSFTGIKMRLRTIFEKRSNAVMVNDRRVFELIYGVRANEYTVCIAEDLAVDLKKKPYANDMMYHEKWITTKYSFKMDANNLGIFLDDMRKVIISSISEEE